MAADKDQRLRVVVAAANWISSYSQAASEPTAPVAARGTIEVTKKVVAAAGVAEQGRFDLTVDGAVKADDVQDGGSTGAVALPIGKHTVGEAAGAGTALGDYSARIACSAPGRDAVAGDGNALEITVAQNDQWKCTITNTRNAGAIEVTKKVVAADGVAEQGRFDLTVDGAVKADDVQDGGSTGAVGVPTGKHTIGEAAGAGTALGDYSARIACSAPGRDAVPSESNALEVTVAKGDQWKCTITNTRKPQPKPDPGPTPPTGDDGGQHVTLSSLSISPKRLALKGPERGARVSWEVSHGAILRLTLQRSVTGRRVAGVCRKVTSANRSRPACRRFVSLRTITRSVAGGAGSLKLVKRFGATRLRPGAYRLIVTAAADAAAQASAPRAVSFKVVRRAR